MYPLLHEVGDVDDPVETGDHPGLEGTDGLLRLPAGGKLSALDQLIGLRPVVVNGHHHRRGAPPIGPDGRIRRARVLRIDDGSRRAAKLPSHGQLQEHAVPEPVPSHAGLGAGVSQGTSRVQHSKSQHRRPRGRVHYRHGYLPLRQQFADRVDMGVDSPPAFRWQHRRDQDPRTNGCFSGGVSPPRDVSKAVERAANQVSRRPKTLPHCRAPFRRETLRTHVRQPSPRTEDPG